MRYFSNFVFMSEKQRRIIGEQRFLARFVSGPYNRLKTLSAAVNAVKSATRISIAKRGELEPKANFFCTKIFYFRSHAERTDATQAYHRGGIDSSRWLIFVNLRQK